jgi:ABC-type uncharacterized transport system permease subunit
MVFIYYCSDLEMFDRYSFSSLVIGVICLFFIIFTFVHAFTNKSITKLDRLLLSIWSISILFLFSLHAMSSWHITKEITDARSMVWTGIDFFMFGAASVATFHYFWILLTYIGFELDKLKLKVREKEI